MQIFLNEIFLLSNDKMEVKSIYFYIPRKTIPFCGHSFGTFFLTATPNLQF